MSIEWLGVLAYGIAAWGFFQARDSRYKLAIALACGINVVYFAAHEMLITAVVVGLTAVRLLLSMVTQSRLLAVGFIAITLSTPWWAPSTDFLPIVAGVVGTIAVFWCRGIAMRKLLLITTSSLMVNAAIGGAWAAFWGESFILAISLYRLHQMIREERGVLPAPAEKQLQIG